MPASAEAAAATREKLHGAAVRLFTSKGFHGTGVREIAKEAGISLGNLYNHHKTKEDMFSALLEEYEAQYTAPGTPLAKALADFEDLDDLENLGKASRQMVQRFSDYIRLIYVDVVELGGEHIHRLFGGMRKRYEETLGPRLAALRAEGKLSDSVDPVAGLMTATIVYFYVFNVEHIFGVKRLYGSSDAKAIDTIATLLREGMLPR
jgi:AcrR family transcriptional regulator